MTDLQEIKDEHRPIAKSMMHPRIIVRIIKMYNDLCLDCKNYTASEVRLGRELTSESLCDNCKEKAQPHLEWLQKHVKP